MKSVAFLKHGFQALFSIFYILSGDNLFLLLTSIILYTLQNNISNWNISDDLQIYKSSWLSFKSICLFLKHLNLTCSKLNSLGTQIFVEYKIKMVPELPLRGFLLLF